jgi:hypothetical protein
VHALHVQHDLRQVEDGCELLFGDGYAIEHRAEVGSERRKYKAIGFYYQD